MAFTPDTPAALEQDQIAAYGTRFTGRDLHTESFLGKLSRAEAQGLWAAQQKLYRISLDAIPNSSSTYDALAAWAVAVGLSDGSTSYGPKAATIATGGIGTVTGSNGSAIPNGTQMVAPDGVTLFATTALQTIAGGAATLTFNAVTPGAAGNLTVPTTLTFTSGVPGVTNAITLTNPLSGGADKESAPALLARLLLRLQNPPKAITASDLRQLVQGLTGVDRAYVYPRRYGTGTADVVFTQAGTGSGRIPGSTTAAQAALDAARNVGCEQLRALVPTTSGSHDLQVRAVPAVRVHVEGVELRAAPGRRCSVGRMKDDLPYQGPATFSRGGRGWADVSPLRRCPVCDGSSWCQVARDGLTVLCKRIGNGARPKVNGAGVDYYVHHHGARAWTPPPAAPLPTTARASALDSRSMMN